MAENYTNTISNNGIIRVNFRSTSAELSYKFLKSLSNRVSDYFIEKTVEKDLENYQIVKSRLDSLSIELAGAEGILAATSNRSTGVVYESGFLTRGKQQRNVEILAAMHLEAIQSSEAARYQLLQNTPLVQIIDYPYKPLSAKPKLGLVNIVLIFLGIVLLGVILIFGISLAKTQYAQIKLKLNEQN